MKTIGMLGGMGPEATIDYYRLMIASFRERRPDGGYPPILINSVDLSRLLAFFEADDKAGATEFLATEMNRLADAGADFGFLSACASHFVFERVRKRSRLPLISIVEAAGLAAERLGLKHMGLIGARFTMQGQFFQSDFSARGILLVLPAPDEQAYIHQIYLGELQKGVFRPETREGLLAIIERMRREQQIQGLVLGGTELPLLLREARDVGIPFLDTTRIHVDRIVGELLS
jgi:aspartate racemase